MWKTLKNVIVLDSKDGKERSEASGPARTGNIL
jgi:hypothetical protein